MKGLLSLILFLLASQTLQSPVAAQAKNTKGNYRTDEQNQALPWYRLVPGVFPPRDAGHHVEGQLVETDVIHRAGVFRSEVTGELVSFTLLPFGAVFYLNAEADLRDVPLGTTLHFDLFQDDKGVFSRAAAIQDDYTRTARLGGRHFVLDTPDETGAMGVFTSFAVHKDDVEPISAPEMVLVDDRTHVWKGGKPGKLSDIALNDRMLCNFTHDPRAKRRRCTDIWVDEASQKLATEQQQKHHLVFLKERGLPAWIDRVEGDEISITLFSGDPTSLQSLFKVENIDPIRWAKEHHRVALGVANEHLRSYWPNVTNRGALVMEFQTAPTDCYGCSGLSLVLQPELMLEGFRKGRNIRLFAPGWPIEPMPFGEGLFAGGHDEEPADSKELLTADFPYRTDFGNENLPWYRLQPNQIPPDHSEHRVGGELVKIDAKARTGQFRTDRTGEVVNFTLPPGASVRYLNAEASPEDLPLGMRCLFFLYQDDKGAFTQAAVIEDEFSSLASNTLTYRFEAAHLDTGKLYVMRHAAPVQTDYVLEPRVPLDFGKVELEVDDKTRVWKGDKQINLTEIAVGDELLVNLAARTPTSRGRCTDIWVGAETHRLATEQQRKKHAALVR